MARSGRPRKTIDWKQMDNFCTLHAPLKEVAAAFEIDPKTLESIVKREKKMTFSQYQNMKAEGLNGNIAVRAAIYKSAIKDGNTKMLALLAKQWLGWIDEPDNQVNVEVKIQNAKETLADKLNRLAAVAEADGVPGESDG